MSRRRGTVGALTGRESCVVGEERVYAGANKPGAEQTKYKTRPGEVCGCAACFCCRGIIRHPTTVDLSHHQVGSSPSAAPVRLLLLLLHSFSSHPHHVCTHSAQTPPLLVSCRGKRHTPLIQKALSKTGGDNRGQGPLPTCLHVSVCAHCLPTQHPPHAAAAVIPPLDRFRPCPRRLLLLLLVSITDHFLLGPVLSPLLLLVTKIQTSHRLPSAPLIVPTVCCLLRIIGPTPATGMPQPPHRPP